MSITFSRYHDPVALTLSRFKHGRGWGSLANPAVF